MQEKYQELLARLLEINDLNSAAALLNWDQTTFMPAGGAAARGRQLATLGRLAQEKLVEPAIGRLLDQLQPWADRLHPDSDEAAMIRTTRHDYEQAAKIPPAFMGEMYGHMSKTYQAWTEARADSDFAKVAPYLEKSVDFSRRLADFFAPYDHVIDPLIHNADYGMKAASVSAIFAELRAALVPIVQAITSQPPADDSCLRQYFPERDQDEFGVEVIRAMGFDFERGRLDKSPHPYTTKFSLGDVRITTRYDEHYFSDAFFGTVHEAGHGMYEQGIRRRFDGTPLGSGMSAGVRESQSRTWENIVVRGRPFWKYFYPRLQGRFPMQLAKVSFESFYRAINKVENSFIRVDADEITYDLHIMLRFDFEMQMLEGKLAVKDLPEAWRERFRQDFGIVPPDDRLGCLQDMHWFSGPIGGSFQGYTLGNILGALFYSQALQARPEILTQLELGKFDALRGWLAENIYRHGRKYPAPELIQRVTGGPIRIGPYIDYLKGKFGELYEL